MIERPARYVPANQRHGSIPFVTTPVVDVSDEERWPEIAAALEHARKLRTAEGGVS